MDTNDRLLTIKEVAEYLGVPITTLYQWRYHRKGPLGLKVGRHVRYRRSDVDQWVENQLDEQTGAPTRYFGSSEVAT